MCMLSDEPDEKDDDDSISDEEAEALWQDLLLGDRMKQDWLEYGECEDGNQ